MAGADGYGQRVATAALHELHGLIRVGIHAVFGRNVFLHARQLSQFGFNPHSALVRVIRHPTSDGDIFFKGQVRAVDHHGRKAAVDAGLAQIKVRSVIEVNHHGQIVFHESRFHQLHDIILPRIFAGPGGHLKNQGRAFLGPGPHDALDDFHVVDVERADGVPFRVSPLEHGAGTGDGHDFLRKINGFSL